MHNTSEQLRLFLEKLREKEQSEEQRIQAEHAVKLYVEMRDRTGNGCVPDEHAVETRDAVSQCVKPSAATGQLQCCIRTRPGSSHYSDAGYQEKTESAEWDELIGKLADEIKVRHYSRKTLKTYALWSRQFQKFLKSKPPAELTTADVKEYLTWLAVKCHVAASTQNQAFNSLFIPLSPCPEA